MSEAVPMHDETTVSRLQAPVKRVRLLILALAVTMIAGFAPSASAVTIVDFEIINPTTTPSVGSNTRADTPGGEFFGDAGGTISLAFQGDGTSIENGAVSIVGGVLSTFSITEIPSIIKVTVDIDSTFVDGDNNNIGMLSGWDGSSGAISFTSVISVLNNGFLACEGSLCGTFGTPPDGTQFDFVDDSVAYPESWQDMAVSFDAGNVDNPFGFQLAESVIGVDATSGDPVNYLSLQGQGAVVPEPGTGLLLATGLVGLAAKRRQR